MKIQLLFLLVTTIVYDCKAFEDGLGGMEMDDADDDYTDKKELDNTNKANMVEEKQEDVTILRKNTFHNEVEELIWCSQANNSTVLAQTDKGEVYSSTNQGDSWTSMISKFSTSSMYQAIGTEYTITEITQSSGNLDVIVFTGESGINWITTNCGKEVKTMVYKDYKIKDFKFHPDDPKHLLATARHDCKEKGRKEEDSNCISKNILLYSLDYGETFSLADDFVYDYMWLKSIQYAFGFEKLAVLYTKLDGKQYEDQPRAISKARDDISVYQSLDLFQSTMKKLVTGGWQMWYSKCCLFVEQSLSKEKKPSRTVSIEAYSKGAKFNEVKIYPPNMYLTVGYLENIKTFYTYMYGTREIGHKLMVADQLKSDYSSSNFNLLLKNLVVKPESDSADFNHVSSVDGVFLANTYDQHAIDYIKKESMNQVSGTTQKTIRSVGDYITTKISFNLGGSWKYLRAPTIDSLGKPIRCSSREDCRLHQNLHTNSMSPPVYSSENASGIIIATGCVGKFLCTNHYDFNTYMSTDGGVNWIEVAKGINIYEIGDQGGLIIMARYKAETKMVRFSYDNGQTWSFINFNENNVFVSNIVIEPTNNDHHFLITGFEFNTAENVKKGVVFHLDFSEYHLRFCKGFEKPEENDSDYEKFVPHSYQNSKCILGKSIHYVRKKPKVRCINPDHYQFYYVDSYCQCTNEDYECDIGFKRSEGGTCVTMNNQEIDLTPPKVCYDKYVVRMGYKKSADNSCVGGIIHEDKELPCPGTFGFFATVFSLVYYILYYGAIIGGIGFGLIWLKGKFSDWKDGDDFGPYQNSSDMYTQKKQSNDNGYSNVNAEKDNLQSKKEGTKREIGSIMDDDDEDDEYAEEI